jgi:protein-L-isoaspartate(D-aspartate) O-methyltransferase
MAEQDHVNDNTDSDNEDDNERIHFFDHREAFFARFLRNVYYEQAGANRNEDLIRNLKETKTLTDKRVEEALLTIPREYFVTPELKEEAYNDHPLRFSKMGFNISAPHMYAMCLEKLDIQPGNVVLDIGSGSGHLTALAGYLTGPTGLIHGLDLFDHIIEFSKKNIAGFLASRPADAPPLTLDHVHFFKRNCFLPSPDEIKYDRIHVGCCCPESHIQFLYDQLKVGGILVTPFGDKLIKAVKQENGIKTETLVSVRYSDLTLPSDAEVKEAQKQIAIAKANKIVVPQTAIRDQFRNLVDNQQFSDFMFIVEGKPIYAHKLLLQLRSEYFRDLFSTGECKMMEITDYTYDVFKEFLKYLYADNCLINENSEQLYKLAKQLHLDALICRIEGKDATGCTLIDELDKLVGSNLYSDITFVVEGSVAVPAHRLILEVRTEYFMRMFSSGLRESQSNKIEIFDCTKSVFRDVLRFIYTDHTTVNDENCISLLEQANFFQLDRLKAICEQYWYDNINVNNAASVLQVADRFNASQLKDFAMEFIFSHIQDVVKTESFQELDQSIVSHILIASVQRSK